VGGVTRVDGRPRDWSGTICRVNGPLVEVTGLADAAMFDVVELGPHRLPAETVAISNGTVTVQAYEYTGGLMVGDGARGTGHPLSARLGPGLLGQVFDGLLRPLSTAPVWLTPTQRAERDGRRWPFTPSATVGQHVAPGVAVGQVATSSGLVHHVLVPPGVSGELTWLAAAGEVDEDALVARVGKSAAIGSLERRGDERGTSEEPSAAIGSLERRGDERGTSEEPSAAIGLWEHWPVRKPRPFALREDAVAPLHTGQRVLDLLFPVGRGSAAAVPGGFGTGKTVLLQQIAKWCDADVIVYVGCGERGNEMADVLGELSELADPRTGGRLIDRTVILANTSNMPMMAREASIYTAITVGEYYRDMGYNAVVIADSTSRWAEALREFASRTGALPAEEGYPADLASALAAFYERAGRVQTLGGSTASVTVVGAVSPPGGDLAEPVTTATQRFVQAVWMLDRELAYSRHYPAVSWAGSFARQVEAIGGWHVERGDPEWAGRRARTATLLAESDRLTALAEIIGASTLPGRERMVMLAGRLIREAVLMQSALNENDAACPPEKGAALLQMVLDIVDACLGLVERGVPATTIEEFDFGPLIRAREEVVGDDTDAIADRRDTVLRDLEELA
jgi:V/A-type H+-transporting ATPase subunit A